MCVRPRTATSPPWPDPATKRAQQRSLTAALAASLPNTGSVSVSCAALGISCVTLHRRPAEPVRAEIYATLLDEGAYLCSISTAYRILEENREVRQRRKQLRHPTYTKPELLAVAPNQVWSWDITKLKGPRKWTYFYLYMIIDIFSRCAVGWCAADYDV